MPGWEDDVEVANPQEPHCPVVLLLDVSGSMQSNRKLQQLSEGLRWFKSEVEGDDLARKRVDLAVITFESDVHVLKSFGPVTEFEPPQLEAQGGTSLGEAVQTALTMISDRKARYRADSVSYYRPWILLITDAERGGLDTEPGTQAWKELVSEVHTGSAKGKFVFFTIAVRPADYDVLRELAPPETPPAELRPGAFKDLFRWLSNSIKATSRSRPGESVAIDTPEKAGWGQVPTSSNDDDEAP